MLNWAYKLGAQQALDDAGVGGSSVAGRNSREDGEDADMPNEEEEQEDDSPSIRTFTAAIEELPNSLSDKAHGANSLQDDPKEPGVDAQVSWSAPAQLRYDVNL